MNTNSQSHVSISDAVIAMRSDSRIGVGQTPYRYLPLYARIAVERLDCDSGLRNFRMLDTLLQSYAQSYSEKVDVETCVSAHHICSKRFWDFEAFKALSSQTEFGAATS